MKYKNYYILSNFAFKTLKIFEIFNQGIIPFKFTVKLFSYIKKKTFLLSLHNSFIMFIDFFSYFFLLVFISYFFRIFYQTFLELSIFYLRYISYLLIRNTLKRYE